MSISSLINRNDYVGNGAVDTYAYSFRIFANTDLVVTVRDADGTETTLTLTTHYTVTGVGATAGGNVALVNGAFAWLDGDGDLATGFTLTILRVRPLTQTVDIRNQGAFFPDIHEDRFDHFIMIDQQQQDQIDRSLKLPQTVDPDDFSMDLPTDIADKENYVIAVNDAGDGLTLIQVPDLDAVVDLDLGASGIAGSLDIFPTTALRGRLRLIATANTNDDILTITNAAQAAAHTYTIPDAGADASFLMTRGAQTIIGAKTFQSSALLLQEVASTDVVTIAVAALAASRIYTMPEVSGDAEFLMTAGAQTKAGVLTLSSQPLFPSTGFAFSTDTDTGIERTAADTVGIFTGGSERLRITGTVTTFGITASSGNTMTLTVSNDSDTASSQVQLRLAVGGPSSGDPFITWEVGGPSQIYAMGIDNSVSDALVLSRGNVLGTTNVFSVSTAGIMTIGSSVLTAFNGTLNGNLAAGSNKITGLAAGTTAGDSIRFEQMKIIQVVTATSNATDTTTSATFTNTSLAASITPTSASNKILVIVSAGRLSGGVSGTNSQFITIKRGSTNIGDTNGMAQLAHATSANQNATGLSILDSPATTSSTTYTVAQASSNGAATVSFGGGSITNTITLLEVAP